MLDIHRPVKIRFGEIQFVPVPGHFPKVVESGGDFGTAGNQFFLELQCAKIEALGECKFTAVVCHGSKRIQTDRDARTLRGEPLPDGQSLLIIRLRLIKISSKVKDFPEVVQDLGNFETACTEI